MTQPNVDRNAASAQTIEALVRSGAAEAGVALIRSAVQAAHVAVRPVITDDLLDWMPALSQHIGSGVVAFVADHVEDAARIAADAAAWLGDRGRNVTLIDGSIERPVISKPLSEDGDEGLVDAVLFGVSHGLVARRTLATGVRVVTAGSQPLSIDSVFQSEHLSSLLTRLSADGPVFLVVPSGRLTAISGLAGAVVAIAGTDDELRNLLDRAAERAGLKKIAVLLTSALTGTQADSAEEGPQVSQERAVGRAEASRPEPAAAGAARERATAASEEPVETRTTAPTAAAAGRAPATGGARRPAARPGWIALAIVVVAAAVYWAVAIAPGRGPEGGGPAADGGAPGEAGQAAQTVNREAGAAEQPLTGLRRESPADVEPPTAGAVQEVPESAAAGTVSRPAGLIEGTGGPYRVLISSHKYEADAEAESAQLSDAGVANEIVPSEVPDRGTWYRIVVAGGYPSWSSATEVLDIIKHLGYEGAWIEREEQLESEELSPQREGTGHAGQSE